MINEQYPNGILHLWTANDTTIYDENINFTDAHITNALLSPWQFNYNTECNWFQKHLMQRNLSLAHKILINSNKSNTISLLWAFRTHNLPFNPILSNNLNQFHNWRKNFINDIFKVINNIIHNNKWLCTLIH